MYAYTKRKPKTKPSRGAAYNDFGQSAATAGVSQFYGADRSRNHAHVAQMQAYQQMADRAVVQKKENKTGLPGNLKSGVESLSGYSMDDVKVHYNSSKPAQLQALAYAQGTDIHVASGQEKHLAHEAWHVVQQKQGRVEGTMRLKDTAINNDTSLEQEADTMGAKAMQATQSPDSLSAKSISNAPVQRYVTLNKGEGVDESDEVDEMRFHNKGQDEDAVKELFSRQESKLGNRDFSQFRYRDLGDAVSLNVSNTGDLAVENVAEPKNYFATPERIDESNGKLESIFSPYEMIHSGAHITIVLPGGEEVTLYKVVPRNKLNDTEGLDAKTVHSCDELGPRVIGMHYNSWAKTQPQINRGPRHYNNDDQSILHNRLTTDQPYISFERELMRKDRDDNEESSFDKYKNLEEDGKSTLANDLGMNESASQNADIGDVFKTLSVAKTKDVTAAGAWNFHWAGIVASSQDKQDHITMENYNRRGKGSTLAGQYVGNKGEDSDKRLFFKMYGKAFGQTYHNTMTNSGLFIDPLTTLYKKPESLQNEQENNYKKFKLTSGTLQDFLRETLGYVPYVEKIQEEDSDDDADADFLKKKEAGERLAERKANQSFAKNIVKIIVGGVVIGMSIYWIMRKIQEDPSKVFTVLFNKNGTPEL